jgi:hypothetical protein
MVGLKARLSAEDGSYQGTASAVPKAAKKEGL